MSDRFPKKGGETMKRLLWRLFGRRFWIKLSSHWRDRHGRHYYGEWEQRKNEIRHYNVYKLLSIR